LSGLGGRGALWLYSAASRASDAGSTRRLRVCRSESSAAAPAANSAKLLGLARPGRDLPRHLVIARNEGPSPHVARTYVATRC